MNVLLARVARSARRRLFSKAPKLPDAVGDRGLTPMGTEPVLRLAVLGDSSAAGVGASTHREALAGQLAVALSGLTGRLVSWRVIAESGATAAKVGAALTRDLTLPTEGWRPDVVVVVVGVNDLLRWRPMPTWRADLTRLLEEVRHRVPEAVVVTSGLPPVDQFPLLPAAVRPAVGFRVRRMDRVIVDVAAETGSDHAPLLGASKADWFASDGFHPSPTGYRAWARILAVAVADTLDSVRQRAGSGLPSAR